MLCLKKPNVIVICADDLGYGDISCYGAQEVQTPNIDKLLEDGIKFNSGYSTSAVCTPARYSLLTGEYPFRNQYTKILPGDAQCIISKEQMTLPKIFKKADYKTAVIGKWHLGLSDGSINWNASIDHTPNDVGFDYSFIFPATNDRVPSVYLKNHDVLNLDPKDPIEVSYDIECPFDDIETYHRNPEKLRVKSAHGHMDSIVNGYGRMGFMRGGHEARWRDEDLAERFLGEVKDFANNENGEPFFIYYALHQPHVPRIPNEKFAGKSVIGARGDVILELDWCVGELVKDLELKGILNDTIIIFTSDNGPVLNDGYNDGSVENNGCHMPAGPLRGGKYSKFEGGARVPLIVSWKNHITKRNSDEIVSQVDFAASFANMLGAELGENDCKDSQNFIDLLIGKNDKGREDVLYESMQKAYVLRKGKWAYLSPSEGEWLAQTTQIEIGNTLDDQLYNLDYDIGQRKNIYENYSHIAEEMKARIQGILES